MNSLYILLCLTYFSVLVCCSYISTEDFAPSLGNFIVSHALVGCSLSPTDAAGNTNEYDFYERMRYNGSNRVGAPTSDGFWKTVNKAIQIAKKARPSARIKYVRRTRYDSLRTNIEVVFDTLREDLLMQNPCYPQSEWQGPISLPATFEYPKSLTFFPWDDLHLGLKEVLDELYRQKYITGLGRYDKWEVYAEPNNPAHIWYYLSHGVGVDFKTLRVDALKKDDIRPGHRVGQTAAMTSV